jgi:hypothetical protein
MISCGLKLERFAIGGYGVHLFLKRFHQNILKTGAPVSHIILLHALCRRRSWSIFNNSNNDDNPNDYHQREEYWRNDAVLS